MRAAYRIQVELEFGDVGLCGGFFSRGPGEKHLRARREPTTNSIYIWNWAGIKPGPHWWAASALNRDLKHQDGRWRWGRHIRINTEARSASRFTRLSRLSSIATATTRQFSEKIPLRNTLKTSRRLQ